MKSLRKSWSPHRCPEAVGAARLSTPGDRHHALWRRVLDHWVRRRAPAHPPISLSYRQVFILPTRFGWTLGALMLAMLIGSLNFNNNLGLFTAFIVGGLAINTTLLAYRNLRHLHIRHGLAAPVFAGQTATFQLTVANTEHRLRPGLELVQGSRRTRFEVAPDSTTEVSLAMPTRRRGWQAVGRLRVETRHPLGLFVAWSWFWPEQPLLVWPRPADPAPPLPDGGRGEFGQAVHHDNDGDEFHSLRRWRESDPLHQIAWKASQRHRTLLSREYRRERSPHVVLEFERAPGRDIEERISSLTAWVLKADQTRRQYTLALPDCLVGPGRGPTHRDRCLRALAEFGNR